MKHVNISQVDVMFANGRYPIEFLFYYEKAIPAKNVRKALRKLAPVFWPLFGEYEDGTIFFDRYREEDCFDEEVVNGEIDVSDIKKAGPEVISRFGPERMKKLFFLKSVRFANGTILIPRQKHIAGDGYSYFTFLAVLAAAAKSSLIPFKASIVKSMFKPHHRRTGLMDFSFRGEELKPDAPYEGITTQTEEVSRQDIQSLIREAASSQNLRISSNDILSAMMVKKLARIQRERWGHEFSLTIPIDVRSRVEEYGRRFLGNGIMSHKVDLDGPRVEKSPPVELAALIRKSMPIVSRETYVRYLENLTGIISEKRWGELRPFDPESGCLVTNLSRLPGERLDFGTGFPRAITPLTLGRNGAGILSSKENFVLKYAY